MVVAFPPGGPVDFVARVIADSLRREPNQRVIVENKPGGNGAVAAQGVAQSADDGTTLRLSSAGAAAINPVLYDKPYDMQRDFSAVSVVVDNDELLVVNPGNPARDAAEFVENARKASQPVAIASSGVGSIPHLAMEQLADATKAALIRTLNTAVRKVLAEPEVSEKLLGSGTTPSPSSPEELSALLKRDTEKWGRLIRAKRITPQG